MTKLNRDITVAQYNTKEGGLKGGFTVDTATVDFITSPIDTVTGTVNSLKQGYEDAKETVNKITDTVGEAAKNLGDVFKTEEEIQKEKDDQIIKEKAEVAKQKLQELLAKVTPDTKEIIEQMGWNGETIENTNNPDVLNQTDKEMLIKYGLPGESGACMFFTKVYAVADTLGITLTPEEMGKIYETAKDNGAVFKQGTNGKKDSAYWINDYQGILESVGSVKGVDTSSVSIPKAMIPVDVSSSKEVTKNIIETLKNGGSAEIRYDKDPANPDSNAHSMRVLGSFVENGNIILSIKDTYYPDKKTYVDTSTMTLYTEDDDKVKTPSKRPVSSYLPITKIKKEDKK